MNIRTAVITINLFVILVLFNFFIFKQEEHLENGRLIFFELAPVDPRSLMQGDYMDLRYALEDLLYNNYKDENYTDKLIKADAIIKIDENNIAHFIKIYAKGDILSQDEIILPFTFQRYVKLPLSSSFFFEEGAAKFYEFASYGVFSYNKGKFILTDLADERKKIIKGPFTDEHYNIFKEEIFTSRMDADDA